MLEAPTEGAWGLRVDDRYIDLVGSRGGAGVDGILAPDDGHHALLVADQRVGVDGAFIEDAVEAVVGHLLAIQAQDYRGALWSIGLRLPGSTAAQIEQAIAEIDRRIAAAKP